MDWDGFFKVHQGLEREGPGEAADVHWVLEQTGVSGAVDILDAGCGPAADLMTFASALPQARLTGIEHIEQFTQEARVRTARFADRVQVLTGDMAEPGGPYDLIWCAGALYFLGVSEGLTKWRGALNPDGWVAFSEPVQLPGTITTVETEFWDGYPLTDLDGITARVEAAGYRVVDHRLIMGDAWAVYFDPMRERLDALRAAGDPSLKQAIEENAREIALWDQAPDRIAYAMMLVQPC